MQNIIFTNRTSSVLADYLNDNDVKEYYVVADVNTVTLAESLFKDITVKPKNYTLLSTGEENKNLESVLKIWNDLIAKEAKRNSLLINIGGGIVTDLGGFAASTFKRGIRHINIPTTLLSQVDASLGGKTGFNYRGLKNEIGTFYEPEKVIIDSTFLETLPQREMKSGYAEILKHGLLSDEEYLSMILENDPCRIDNVILADLIYRSVQVKYDIVTSDPLERGVRKSLNFGHTVGHAIEGLMMKHGIDMSHGEAVAIGMIVELFISVLRKGFPIITYSKIKDFIMSNYLIYPLYENADMLYDLMLHDKKNEKKGVNFTLLSNVGEYSIDNYCEKNEIIEALRIL